MLQRLNDESVKSSQLHVLAIPLPVRGPPRRLGGGGGVPRPSRAHLPLLKGAADVAALCAWFHLP